MSALWVPLLSVVGSLVTTSEGEVTAGPRVGARVEAVTSRAGEAGAASGRFTFGFERVEVGSDVRVSVGSNVSASAEVGVRARARLLDLGALSLNAVGDFSAVWTGDSPGWGATATAGVQAVVALSPRVSVSVDARAMLLLDAALIRYQGRFALPVGFGDGGFSFDGVIVGGASSTASVSVALAPRLTVSATAQAALIQPYSRWRPSIAFVVGPDFAL